jgi:hypothetical protein
VERRNSSTTHDEPRGTSGSFIKIVSKCQPLAKTEKQKMARNSGCGGYHLFDILVCLSFRLLLTNVG